MGESFSDTKSLVVLAGIRVNERLIQCPFKYFQSPSTSNKNFAISNLPPISTGHASSKFSAKAYAGFANRFEGTNKIISVSIQRQQSEFFLPHLENYSNEKVRSRGGIYVLTKFFWNSLDVLIF